MQIRLRLKPEISVLVLYFLYLLILTMKPFEFSGSSENRFELLDGFYSLNVMDVTLNILLFIPFGFLLFSLMKNTFWKDYIKILVCGVLGFGLSFIIETYQLFLPRDPGLSDVCFNAVGSLIGAGLAKPYNNKIFSIARYSWGRMQRSRSLLTLIVILYSAALFSLSVLLIKGIAFINWNPGFTFQIGNEATLDRPWVGKVYLVAIYNRDLSDKEVYRNFKSGPYSSNSTRIKDGLVAFYNFSEGSGNTIHDSSGFRLPVNLTIDNPSKVRWLTPNGLEILGNTIIKSKVPAEKLYRAIKSTNKITLEVWIAPTNMGQEGPARIVSFSKNPYRRNLTLGQEERNIDFRLRTPLSGLNGTDINLKTSDGFLTTEVQHLVATYEEGVQRFFVNGVEHSRLALFDKVNKLQVFFGSNLLSKIAFCLFFFFPLSFLSYALFLNYFCKPKSFILSVFLSLGLLVIIQVLYIALLHEGFDFTLISLVILVSIMAAFFTELTKSQMAH